MKKWMLILSCLFISIGIAVAQTTQATGIVVDDTGEEIIGASIVVKGTNTGTVTDIDGKFSVSLPSGKDVLVISYVGMKTKEVKASSNMRVVLASNANLDELIVVGYGTVKKSELTGAVSKVNIEDIKGVPVTSVAQALQGKVSGLQVGSTSGRTGDATQLSIRGVGSISASTEVLYVIDGVPVTTISSLSYDGSSSMTTSTPSPMSSLSPNDIESIEVLKDAASAAIYGARASNGVVLITTKGGKFNQKTQVTVSANMGVQSLVKKPNLLNAEQYVNVHNAALNRYKDDIAAGRAPAPSSSTALNPIESLGYNTNWVDNVLRNTSLIKDFQVGVSGGDEKTSVYFGASFLDQEGALKDDKYTKGTLKLNVDRRLASNVKFGVRSYLAVSKAVPLDEDNNVYQPWSAAQHARPDSPIYDEDGKLVVSSFINPMHAFERDIADKWTRIGGNAFIEWTILKGLVYNATAGGNISTRRFSYYDAANTRRGESAGTPKGYGYYVTGYNHDYIYENTLTYRGNAFSDRLSYTVMGGLSYQRFTEESSYIKGEGFASTDLKWLVSAGKINDGDVQYTSNAMSSGFGRVQLAWDDKYSLMLSVRRDGSSKFTKDNRWDNFYAASAGWTVSKEDFFPKNDYLNDLKVRVSYGETGQQDGIGNASGQDLLEGGKNYYGRPGMAKPKFYNPDLHWETGRAFNVGLDLSLFNRRMDIAFNYYSKISDDLLYNKSVQHETGFKTSVANVGKMKNTGVELDVSGLIIKGNDFKWSATANFSYNKNEMMRISDGADYFTRGFVSIVKKGHSLGSFFLVKSLGVAQEEVQMKDKDGNVTKTIYPGEMLYEDLDGDGYITDADRQVFKGGIAPVFGGVGTTISYKGFDLQAFAQYSLGKKVYRMNNYSGTGSMNGGAVGFPSYSNNMLTDILGAWTPERPSADIPAVTLNPTVASWNTRHSTRFLEKADYLRMANLTLGYTFNTAKFPAIKSLRVYVQAKNLFTITQFDGLDPEVYYVDPESTNNRVTAGVDSNGIPNMRSFNFGLNLTF